MTNMPKAVYAPLVPGASRKEFCTVMGFSDDRYILVRGEWTGLSHRNAFTCPITECDTIPETK